MMKEAMLYRKINGTDLECYLCCHYCKIQDSKYGFCGVRQNRKGALYTLVYGEVIASHLDPIEKKPLYHFLPGTTSYSIATIGCNFRCGFCQNWQISQASKRNGTDLTSYELKPQEVIREAKKNNARSISYTYTEPTIFFEYAYDTARLAKEQGLCNNFVTNGYMTEQAIKTIQPFLDAANVDLKAFSDDTYRKVCSGRLQPVLDSIRLMKELNIWVEITTLLVPGMNDSEAEMTKIAEFIAGIGKEIPWHVSRFHPDYKYLESIPTPLRSLEQAEKVGKKAGLQYVYIGNVAGQGSDTFCHNCGNLLIKRLGYFIEKNSITGGKCPECGIGIQGIW